MKLNVRVEGRYPRAENGERLPPYDIAVGCDVQGTTSQREAARVDLVNFMAPADARKVEHWLGELSLLTAGRGREGLDAELMLNAYASRLSTYPADVVRYALLTKTWKWFPAWDELEQVCEAKTSPRRHMLSALSAPAPAPEPTRRPPTQEERDAVQAMVAEMFPERTTAERDAAVEIALRGDCMEGDDQ